MNKTAIYKYIDEKGIPYRKMSSIMSINIDESRHLTVDRESYNFIQLCLPFGISEQQQIEVVLDYIYDLTNFRVKNINDLLRLKSLDHRPFILEISGTDYENKLYLAFKKIPGSIVIRGDQQYKDNGDQIKTLGNIEFIKGDLGISNSLIENFGNLKEVTGDLWFSANGEFRKNGFKIRTLSPLEKVGGTVSIRGEVESLGTLRHVGKNLSLRFSNVKDLGNLEFVGKNLLISKINEQYYDFSKVKIGGKIMRYNDKSELTIN